MIPRKYLTTGIVLARRNYGEADRILVVYTKDYGRISLIAKGIRRPTSRKRGHLEIFNLIKFSAVKGKGLDIMTEVENIDMFPTIRKNLKKVTLAYYFMEVIGRTTHEHEPHKELYDLIIWYLEKLKTETNLKALRLDFILRLLTVLGFWPRNKKMSDPDKALEEVTERQLSSVRVGKRVLE